MDIKTRRLLIAVMGAAAQAQEVFATLARGLQELLDEGAPILAPPLELLLASAPPLELAGPSASPPPPPPPALPQPEPQPTSPLSGREELVLRGLIDGHANKVIARNLGIADATVKVHVKAVMRKLRVANRTQAALWGLDNLDRLNGVRQPAAVDAVTNG